MIQVADHSYPLVSAEPLRESVVHGLAELS
jgi:hypothetical protein